MSFYLVRSFILGSLLSFTGLVTFAQSEPVSAQAHSVIMYKDPFCGCCEGWAAHMKAAGFDVTIKAEDDMDAIKAHHGVSPKLASCHTAIVDGYVIEGHVPAQAVKQLLAGRPQAKGLTVPGMPIGAPGMEAPGSTPDTYDVLLFKGDQSKPFARFEGKKAL
ncbi:DUF411 domain-containing protein [Brucella sp. BE17]|uniref:DUF411 domain-containing protein n=1 Tax=Brucella sp. BE17 TaxID=3142977 RepID=UPI0031B9EEA0